jgi:hypothetical protein
MKTMKTIQVVSLSLLAGYAMLSACAKDDSAFNTPGSQVADKSSVGPLPSAAYVTYADWREDFTYASSLILRWNLYGEPKPQWVNNALGRYGLFDNNGTYPSGSMAVSKTRIGDGRGYTIESDVCIITDPEGAFISPGIGVTRQAITSSSEAVPQMPEAGLSLRLVYVGEGALNVLPVYRNNTYIEAKAVMYDGTTATLGDYAVGVDSPSDNGWYKLKIVVDGTNHVKYYVNNQLVWAPASKIEASLLKNKNLMLGFFSPGSNYTTGKAYHDFVKVSYLVNSAVSDPIIADRQD